MPANPFERTYSPLLHTDIQIKTQMERINNFVFFFCSHGRNEKYFFGARSACCKCRYLALCASWAYYVLRLWLMNYSYGFRLNISCVFNAVCLCVCVSPQENVYFKIHLIYGQIERPVSSVHHKCNKKICAEISSTKFSNFTENFVVIKLFSSSTLFIWLGCPF